MMMVSGIDIATMCHLTGGPSSMYYAGINLTVLLMIFVLPLNSWVIVTLSFFIQVQYTEM